MQYDVPPQYYSILGSSLMGLAHDSQMMKTRIEGTVVRRSGNRFPPVQSSAARAADSLEVIVVKGKVSTENMGNLIPSSRLLPVAVLDVGQSGSFFAELVPGIYTFFLSDPSLKPLFYSNRFDGFGNFLSTDVRGSRLFLTLYDERDALF